MEKSQVSPSKKTDRQQTDQMKFQSGTKTDGWF